MQPAVAASVELPEDCPINLIPASAVYGLVITCQSFEFDLAGATSGAIRVSSTAAFKAFSADSSSGKDGARGLGVWCSREW